MTEQELLAVLDMSEDEQQIWLIKKEVMVGAVLQCKGGSELPCPSESLADLAFRLRDEVVAKSHADFHEAIYDIMVKVEGNDNWATAFWGECIAKPIHWIIAALIAKDKDDE